MERKRFIGLLLIVFGFLFVIGIGVFIFLNFQKKEPVKEFDVDLIQKQAVAYDDMFRISCDKSKNIMAGDLVSCTVLLNPDLQNYPALSDTLEYISFDYNLGSFLKLKDVSIKSPYRTKTYSSFLLDNSVSNKIILKNMYQRDHHKDVLCDSDGDNCRISGRTSYTVTGGNREIYDDSIANLEFVFKFTLSKDVTYLDKIQFDIKNLYFYSCDYGRNEEEDVKHFYSIENMSYEMMANQLFDSSSYNDYSVLYKIRVNNENGAFVYIDYSNDMVGNKLENNKELDVIGEGIRYSKGMNANNFVLDNYKDNYYLLVRFDNKIGYIKYNDVVVIDDSINYNKKQDNKRYYIYNDQYLYKGPGLFGQNSEAVIPKGEIISASIYHNIGSANWLYVDYQGKKGWILEAVHNSNNYPYNKIFYGSANYIEEKSGTLNIGSNGKALYKYAFGSDKIMTLPSNITVKYDYITSDTGISYYHVNYNGTEGWIK